MHNEENTEQITKTRKKRVTIIPAPEPYFDEYLDVNKRLYKMEVLLKKLRISKLLFFSLAEQRLFHIGRFGVKYYVPKEPFLKYLDSVHLEIRTSENDPPAYGLKGNVIESLTVAKTPLIEVPDCKPTSEYAKRINMSQKTILTRCVSGELSWFRIGGTVRISEDDWAKALYNTADVVQKRKPRKTTKSPSP